jgi:hypothetical protein
MVVHRPAVPPVTPDARRLRDALAQSTPLAALLQRQRDSMARLACLQGALPEALAPHVRAGPLDDESWTLLAANGAVAAKLRQLQPRIEQALRASGWPVRALRIRISPA